MFYLTCVWKGMCLHFSESLSKQRLDTTVVLPHNLLVYPL